MKKTLHTDLVGAVVKAVLTFGHGETIVGPVRAAWLDYDKGQGNLVLAILHSDGRLIYASAEHYDFHVKG